jgi:hypothetical protein
MVAEQRRVGAYAKLLANYASDDAIMAAGEAAELLFVRGLAFCATSDSDGYITEAQMIRYVGAGMRDAAKRAGRLVDSGVWERVDGGYLIAHWRFYRSDVAFRPGIPVAVRRAVMERDNFACVKCGATDRLSLDHIIRYRDGGPDIVENLRVLCLPCNWERG